MRILIAQSKESLSQELAEGFHRHSLMAEIALSGADVLALVQERPFDVMILAMRLPDICGPELCSQIRRAGFGTPIIILSDIDDKDEKIRALNSGADDYLINPIDMDELLAHMRAMVRRCQADEASVLRLDDLEMDVANRSVTRAGQPVVLTPREFALLEFLMRNRNRVVSRTLIGDQVWGLNFREDSSNVVDVYVSRIRRKLDQGNRNLIRTAPGIGYILSAEQLTGISH